MSRNINDLMRQALRGDAKSLQSLYSDGGLGQHRNADLARAERAVAKVQREAERAQREQNRMLAKAERDQRALDRQRDRENRESTKAHQSDAEGFFTDASGRVRPITAPSGATMRRWGGKDGVLWDPITGQPYLRDDNGNMTAADPKEHGSTVKKNGSVYRALPGMKWEWLGYDKDNLRPEKGLAAELKEKTRFLNEEAKQASGELTLANKDLASDRARLREVNAFLKQPKFLSDSPERTALLQEQSQIEGGLKAKVDRQAQLEVEAYRARAAVGDWIKERDTRLSEHMSQRSASAVSVDKLPNTDRNVERPGKLLSMMIAEQMLFGSSSGMVGGTPVRPSGDVIADLSAAMAKNDASRLAAVNKVMGAALEQNAWNRSVEQLKAREKADVSKLSADTPIKLDPVTAKRLGMEFVPPNWLTTEAIERQVTARLAGQDVVNLPDNWRLEGGKVLADRPEVDRLWGVKLPWTERQTTQEIGTLRFNDFGVPFIELSHGVSPSFNSGDYYSGIPEFSAMPSEWRADFGKQLLQGTQAIHDRASQSHIDTSVKAEATAHIKGLHQQSISELAENAWQGAKWDAERIRDTLDSWQAANDAQRADLIAEIHPNQAMLPPEDRRLNLSELFHSGQLSAQDARMLGKLAYGTDPGLVPMQDAFKAWASASTSDSAEALRAFAGSHAKSSFWDIAKDWLAGGTAATATKAGLVGAETMRVRQEKMFEAKSEFLTEYFRENRHRVDFDVASFVAARNEFLGNESVVPWAINGVNHALQNAAASSVALFWGLGKLIADSASGGRVLTTEERGLIDDQTMLSLDNMKRAVVDRMPQSIGEGVLMAFGPAYLFSQGLRDKLWYGRNGAVLNNAVNALITDIDRGVLTPESFAEHGRKIEEAGRAYAELSGVVRASYEFDINDPRSGMGQALLAYSDTLNPAYSAMIHAGAVSSQLEMGVQEIAAAHASNHGAISESDYFGPAHLAWRGGQVAPLTEMGTELIATFLTVGVGKALTVGHHLTRGARAGHALNSMNRVLDDVAGLQQRIYQAGLVPRPFGRALTAGEDAWNNIATVGKQLGASGMGEFGQEFIQAFGEAGASIGDALADGVVGFIGGMGLGGVHGSVGFGLGQVQLARMQTARNRALESFVKHYNEHTPQAPITVDQARQAQAYQSVPTVAMLNARVRELMAADVRSAAVVAEVGTQRAALITEAGTHVAGTPAQLAALDERLAGLLGERLTIRTELAAAMIDVVGVRQASLSAVMDVNGLGAEREMVDAAVRLASSTPLSPTQETILMEAGVYQSPASGVMIVPDSLRADIAELAPWVAKNYFSVTEAEQLSAAQQSLEAGAAGPVPVGSSPPPLPEPAQAPAPEAPEIPNASAPASMPAPGALPAPVATPASSSLPVSAPEAPAQSGAGFYEFGAVYRPNGGTSSVSVSQRVQADSRQDAELKRDRWLAGLARVGEVLQTTPAVYEAGSGLSAPSETASAVDPSIFRAKPTAGTVLKMLDAALGGVLDQVVLPVSISKALWTDAAGAILTDEQVAAARAAGTKLVRIANPMAYRNGRVYVGVANLAKTLAQVAPELRAEHLRRMWREESVHHATLETRSMAELAEDWNRLPDQAKQRVIETYYMARLKKAGGNWRQVEVDPAEAGAEFWRMYVTAKLDGATTEQTGFADFVDSLASRDAGLSSRLRDALEKVVDWLRNELLPSLDGELRVEFEAVADSIEAALVTMGSSVIPPSAELAAAPQDKAAAPREPAAVAQPDTREASPVLPPPFVPVDDSALWTPQAVKASLKLVAASFGYKIVDTGINIGVSDRWGNNVNLGTALYDKLVPGNELGRWIDNLANSSVHAEIADRVTHPGLHRVWFGHDFATNLSEVVGEFGWTAIPNYVGQLLKDSLTTSGIPLPGVELLVRADVVSDRLATDWLSTNIGQVFGGGIAFLGTWQLARQVKRGSLTKPRVVFATVGVGVKLVAGVLTAQPFLILSGLADAAILVTNLDDVRAAFKKGAEVAKTKPAAEAVADAEAEGGSSSAIDAPRPPPQPVVRRSPAATRGKRGGGVPVPRVRPPSSSRGTGPVADKLPAVELVAPQPAPDAAASIAKINAELARRPEAAEVAERVEAQPAENIVSPAPDAVEDRAEGGRANYEAADTEQALAEAMVADLVAFGLTEQQAVALVEGDITFEQATDGLSDQAVDDADAVMRGGRERLDDLGQAQAEQSRAEYDALRAEMNSWRDQNGQPVSKDNAERVVFSSKKKHPVKAEVSLLELSDGRWIYGLDVAFSVGSLEGRAAPIGFGGQTFTSRGNALGRAIGEIERMARGVVQKQDSMVTKTQREAALAVVAWASDQFAQLGAVQDGQQQLVLGAAPAPVFDTSASTSEVKALRLAKRVVSENGYDFYAVGRLVDEFYKAEKYQDLPSNGVLVPVPSTTGRNVAPEMLAGRISRDHGQRIFLGQVAVNAAAQESKAKLSIWRKLEDPVVYEVVPEAIEELRREAKGAPIILVEDVINTGESVVEFARVLEDAGLRVTNAAALGAASMQRATRRDLERLSEKVAADTDLSVDAVRPLVYDLFDGAYKKFAAEAERRIQSERGGWRFVRNAERATGRSPSNFERAQAGTGEAASGQGRRGRTDSGGGGLALGAAPAPSVMEQMDLFGASVPVEVRDLVTDNLGLASYHANKYQNIPNVAFEDLQQEAFIALMRAAETFNPELGTPFGAYATRVIKNKLNNLFRNAVRRAKNEELTLDQESSSREGETVKDQLVDVAAGTTEASDLAVLEEILAAVPGRARTIVQLMAEGRNWREIGKEVGLSHEGARKVAMATMAQMRRELEARGVSGVADLLNMDAREKAAATGAFEMEDEATTGGFLGAAAVVEANRLAGEQLRAVSTEGRVIARIRQTNGATPPTGAMGEALSEFYHIWFRGRLDKVDFLAPGMKDALLDSGRDKALAAAALNAMMRQMWEAVQKNFGNPKFWAKNRRRLDSFVNELLPTAARLEVAAIDENGAFVWKPFKMRVGTIRANQVKDIKIGQKVSTRRGTFELGDKVGETDRHVLLRPITAAEQQHIYSEFWKKYPESATFLDRWIMPGMEKARLVNADGTETAEFNRYALLDVFNDWPEEFKQEYGGVALTEMPYVEGYTPDVMYARTLVGVITTLLNEFVSPARKFKSGWARESGNVRNLFEGFSVRAMEAHLEKIRIQERARLVEAASVREDAIPQDKKDQYVPLDEVFVRMMAAVRMAQRTSDDAAVSLVRSLGIGSQEQLMKVFGDAFRLQGRGLMVHKAVAHELMLGAARQATNNILTRVLNFLLDRYNAGLIATGFSLITNWVSNEGVFKPVRVANRLFYSAFLLTEGQGPAAEVAAREALHILRGMVMDRSIMPGAKARLDSLVTRDIFDDQTALEAVGLDRSMGVREQLARLNVGGAFLQAVGYGNVDVRQKAQLQYAAYRAHAEVALKEAKRRGEVKEGMSKEQRLKWMQDWLKAQGQEFHRDVYQTTVLYLMDYQNVPSILDPSQSATGWSQVAKKALLPFAKWPFNMLKQMKRLSYNSVLDVLLAGRTKDERRNAAANLMTLGGLAGVGAVVAGFEEEDDPLFGSNWDSEGKLRVAEARTGNRLNMSRVGRVVAAHALMRDVDLQEEDGGADGKDVYWRYRNYPYLKEALVLGLLLNGEGARSREALMDVVDEYVTSGLLVKFAGLDSWDKGKRDDFRMTEAIYDLLASPVAPKPWRVFAGRIVDPVVRRTRPLPSMGYEGGAMDAIRVNTPGLSKSVPAAGTYRQSALSPFSAEEWFKGESQKIARRKDLSDQQKVRAVDGLRAELSSKEARSSQDQFEVLRGAGLPVGDAFGSASSMRQLAADVDRLRSMGVGPESWRMNERGRVVMAVPETVPVRPAGLELLRFFGGANLKVVPGETRK